MVVGIVFSINSINRMPPAGSLLLKAMVIGHSNQAAEYTYLYRKTLRIEIQKVQLWTVRR